MGKIDTVEKFKNKWDLEEIKENHMLLRSYLMVEDLDFAKEIIKKYEGIFEDYYECTEANGGGFIDGGDIVELVYLEMVYYNEELKKTIFQVSELAYMFGIYYVKIGELKESLKYFQESLWYNPIYIGAHYEKAKVYRMMGDYEGAKEVLDECRKYVYDTDDASLILKEYFYYFSKLGNHNMALACLGVSNELVENDRMDFSECTEVMREVAKEVKTKEGMENFFRGASDYIRSNGVTISSNETIEVLKCIAQVCMGEGKGNEGMYLMWIEYLMRLV